MINDAMSMGEVAYIRNSMDTSNKFYERMLEDRSKAWNDYYNLCSLGGSIGFFELLKVVNLKNPFEKETLKEIASFLQKKLGE